LGKNYDVGGERKASGALVTKKENEYSQKKNGEDRGATT